MNALIDTPYEEAINLPDLDFDAIEIVSVRESVGLPETGASSGFQASCSCCGSCSCCSS